MTIEKQPFANVSPIKNDVFPLSCWFFWVYTPRLHHLEQAQQVSAPTTAECDLQPATIKKDAKLVKNNIPSSKWIMDFPKYRYFN